MSVRKRITAKGTVKWMIDMALPNGQRHRKHFDTKEEADETHHKMKVRIYEGTWAIKEPKMITFEDLVPMYIGYCRLNKSKSNVRSDECGIVKHLNEHFGDMFLTEITVDMVEDYGVSKKDRYKKLPEPRSTSMLC